MSVERSTHTATPLLSREVLIIGGMAGEGAGLETAELFDARSSQVREVGSLTRARGSHTATLLRDGKVLVAGGYDRDYLQSMEVYDPATGRFVAAGDMTQARSGHTATLLSDGRVLFVGGVGHGWTFLETAEIYDPLTKRSLTVGSMSVPRESHTATMLQDGSVLILGGHTGRREAMRVHALAERFDPATERFDSTGALSTSRHKHDAVMLADGRVLVIGGADRTDRVQYATTEIFDPARRLFMPGPAMTEPRYKIAGTSVLLPDGNVLVTAGARSAEILDTSRWTFQTIQGRFPEAYRFAASAALPGGDVVIAGGYSTGVINTAGIWLIQRP
jgi:hypothetical protein